MVCPKCSSANPDGKHFCGDCGSSLDPIGDEFRRNVQAVMREQLRDQKLVEIETTDAVIARLKTLTRPVLYAAAIAIAVLGVVGVRSAKDILDGMRTAQQQAIQQLRQQASSETQSLAQEADSIRAQYRRLGDQQDLVEKLRQAETQLKAIQTAGKSLKQRYEEMSSELASHAPSPNTGATAASGSGVSGEVALSLRGNRGDRSQEAGNTPAVYALGSSGTQVERIQSRLRELGCYSGEVSGSFDQRTKDAVSRFNEARGDLLGPGVVDTATWGALFSSRSSARCR
jgi:hypothetical protein